MPPLSPASMPRFTLKHSAFVGPCALLLATLAACEGTEGDGYVDLETIHVQGRVTDAETGEGVGGAAVALLWRIGANGTGRSRADTSDAMGRYDLVVDFTDEFSSHANCRPETFVLAIANIVEFPEYEQTFIPEERRIDCTETVQVRDLHLRRTGGRAALQADPSPFR